ncbi:MAG: hypothetical protein DHS20C07_18850 [Methyloligella sp.]|nr:MAG: hypothetical protein DHS20C07_18850 [Methyloligella sp.]
MIKPVSLKEVEQTSDHFTEMLETIQNNKHHDSHLQGLRDCRWLFETWIAQLHKENKELKEKLSLYEWRDIKDAPKDKVMFITFKNSLGKDRVVKALYAGKYEIEDEFSIGDFTEYDEKTDRNYWPEGWYEDVEAETGLDYSFHHLGDISPTAYMNIPTPPSTQEEA